MLSPKKISTFLQSSLATNCLIIAEVAQAHDGSLGMAHSFIDAIAKTGADAVKFQTHFASKESTKEEPWRIKFSPQDETRYDYWKRMEFTEDQWNGLKKHAEERKLLFLSSPFSIKAIELLEKIGVAGWKIASGEVNNALLLKKIIESKIPIILSTGMSSLKEVDTAVNQIKKRNLPLAVLQCTSAYPCPPERIGLNMIPFFRERYGCKVGLSDHSGTIYPGLAAATIGIDILEVHVTLHREMFGPDVLSSVTTTELKQLIEGIRFIEKMLDNPINKKQMPNDIISIRRLFTKSVVARTDIPAGTILKKGNLTVKKPGTGIPAARIMELIGLRLKRDLKSDELIKEEDLEDVNET